MNNSIKKAAAAMLLCPPFSASADILTEAHLYGRVEQFLDAGAVLFCGVQIVGIENFRDRSSGAVMRLNISFWLNKSLQPMVAITASEIDLKLMRAGHQEDDVKRLRVENVWIKAPNSPSTSPAEGKSVSRGKEDPLSISYLAKNDPFFSVLRSIRQKESIQIGVTVAGRQPDRILFGVVDVSEAQMLQHSQCVTELEDAEKKNRNLK